MRVPLSWLRAFADVPEQVTARALADRLLAAGLEVEAVHTVDVTGPLVLGRVLGYEVETHSNGKSIRWCQVDVGEPAPRGIVCGAHNFDVGDLVVVALPGCVLPGGFAITARRTYGHVSDGMICSLSELALGDEHDGILVLGPADLVAPDGAGRDAAPGGDARGVLGLPEAVLDIAVTPDRGYCLSVRGVAREAATAYGVAFRDPADPARLGEVAAGPAAAGGWPVQVEDTGGCDRFVARTARGLDPHARSPLWLRSRLHLAGMRPVSLAVDVTNHVMLELGQPIHGYDGDRLAGPVVVRRARPDETIETLDGKQRALHAEDLVIADDSGAIGVAGVMGGSSTEMSPATTTVVVEAAHFDPVVVARSARRHRLPSEASRRFERGVDPDLPLVAAGLVVRMLVDLAGATPDPAATDVDLRPAPRPVTLRPDLPARVAGRPFEPQEVRAHLQAVGCTIAGPGSAGGPGSAHLVVTPPSWRPDLTDPVDLVEEVVRLAGYDTVPATVPRGPASRGLTLAQQHELRIVRMMAYLGGVQVISYPFVGDALLDALQIPADAPERRRVRLANPISDSEPYLRTTLLPGLLQALRRNVGRGISDVVMFEVGRVFRPRPGQQVATPRLPVDRRPTEDELAALEAGLPDQPRRLCLVVCGKTERDGWWGPGREAQWLEAIAAARMAARAIDAPLDVRAAQQDPWHPGRCAALVIDDQVIGYAGELHPRAVAALGLPGRVGAVELDIDLLSAYAQPIVPAPRVSTFPPAREDLAFVVAADVPAAALEQAIRSGAGELLENVWLFDVYEGPQVGDGRKSLAYTVTLRAADHTLTVDELAAARAAIVSSAAQEVGAVLRGG